MVSQTYFKPTEQLLPKMAKITQHFLSDKYHKHIVKMNRKSPKQLLVDKTIADYNFSSAPQAAHYMVDMATFKDIGRSSSGIVTHRTKHFKKGLS